MSAALVNRSISTIKTELEFLRDSEVISEDFYTQVVSKLPDRYQDGSQPFSGKSPTPASAPSTAQIVVPVEKKEEQEPLQPEAEFVEAIYEYRAQQPEDLELHARDKVRVIEHTSSDWWKGEINGRVGMFPSNYVKRVEKRAVSPAPSYDQSQKIQQYGQYPPQQQYSAQGYYNNTEYQQQQMQQMPAQAPQQVVVQQPQAGEPQKHSGLHRFGSKLGNAAIFGAGATIGSDIVNSIF